MTLPVILAHARGNAEEKAFWRRTIERGEIAEADLDRAVGLIRRHGALDETFARARRHGAAAKAALDVLPDSEHRRALLEVVEFCVARAY